MPYREVFAVTAPTKTPANAPVNEIGYQQAVGQYMWWLYENETTPELIWPQSVYVYDQMRRTDSQVGSILRAVNLLVLRTPWRIDPNGARDEVVQLVADDLGLPIVGQNPKSPPRTKGRFSWKEHLAEALLMLPIGYSYFEQVYQVDPDGNRAHLRKLALRPARTIEYVNVAQDGGLVSIKQYWIRSGERPQPIPVERLVAYIHAKEGGNWLGTSILRNCYKNWLLKDRLLRVQAQTIERNGMGIPLYTGQEGASDLSGGLAMAKGWRAGDAAGTAIPFGASLKLVGVEGTLPDAEPAIRYHDESIAKTVLAHFLNLGQQMGTGSYALGATLGDFFTLGVQTVAQQIADTATCHIIEDLVDINFGEDEPAPRLTFDEIGSRQAATAQALKLLIDTGVIHPDEILEESTRQQYGLPPRDPNAPPPGPLPGLMRETLTGPAPGTAAPTPAAAVVDPKAVAAGAADEPVEDPAESEDEATDALITALAEFSGEIQASFSEAAHPRNPKGAPGGGRFRSLVQRIGDALDAWSKGDGHDDPLKDFNREQLRTVAVKRGVSLKRGAPREDIAKAILDDLKIDVRTKRDNPPPKPSAKFTLKGEAHRNKDVAVFHEADGRVSVYEQSDSGARGARVMTAPNLAGLEKWANDHGESELAAWARKEGGVPEVAAPPKAVEKAAPTGRAALDVLPVHISTRALGGLTDDVRGLDSLTPRQRAQVVEAVDAYRGLGYKAINKHLRSGDSARGTKSAVAGIDRAMDQSPLPEPIVVYRGVKTGESVLGPAADWPDDLTGREWTDAGYPSTTASREIAETGGRVTMRVTVPAGIGAIKLSDFEQEVLLERGLTFRVVRDHGPDEFVDGFGRRHQTDRLLDVEVVPNKGGKPGTSAPAKAVEKAAKSPRRGAEALAAAPVQYTTGDSLGKQTGVLHGADLSPEHAAALERYSLAGFRRTNRDLREGRTPKDVALLDDVMAASKLTNDVEVERGVRTGREIFGDPSTWPASFVGRDFTDPAYVSTGTTEGPPALFSTTDDLAVSNGMKLRIHVPAGTGAVGIGAEHELLLDRGLRFHVVGDSGVPSDPYGARVLDVEVVPNKGGKPGTSAPAKAVEKAAERVPAKKAVPEAPSAPDLTGANGLSTDPAIRQIQVDNRIREAYAKLAAKPGDWVGLAALRNQLGEGVNRHEVDASLKRLEQEPGANIVPESNQKTLTQADRDAAVVIGDQAKHAIMLQDPSLRQAPVAAPATKAAPRKATSTPEAALADLRALPSTEDVRDALDLHTIPQLKALMPAGMSKTGKKRDLVDRLTDHVRSGGLPAKKPAPAKADGAPKVSGSYVGPTYKVPPGVKQADVDEYRALTDLGTKLDTDQYWRLDELTQSLPAAVRRRAKQDGHLQEHFDEFRARNAAGKSPAQLRGEMAAAAKEAFADKRVAVRVTPTGLARLLDDGRFKTFYEHGRSESFDPSSRSESEQAMFGLDPNTNPTARPIYGYVMVEGDRPAGDSETDALSQYGRVQVVLKDGVRSRTTAMFGDSLDNEQFGRPSPIDNPTWESFTPSTGGVIGRWLATTHRDTTDPGFQRATYVEAEVHGGVTVDDIAEVLLPSDASAGLKAQLDAAGVPWRIPGASTRTPAKRALKPVTPKAPAKPARRTAGRVVARDQLDAMLPDTAEIRKMSLDTRHDAALSEIARRQGFDGKPKVSTRGEMDDAVASGWTEVWRGIYAGPAAGDKTPADLSAGFRAGTFEPGHGLYGNGVYTSTRRISGETFRDRLIRPDASPPPGQDFTLADMEAGDLPADSLLRIAIDPAARIGDYDELRAEQDRWFETVGKWSAEGRLFGDLGRFAAARGYDAIHVRGSGGKHNYDDGGTYPDGVPQADQYVILNRTALMVQRAEDAP